MKKILFVTMLAAIVLSANSCRTLNSAALNPKMKNEKLLPPLTPVLDMESFGFIFGITQTYVSSPGFTTMTMTAYSNPVLNDINVIFRRDVSENICAGLLGNKGTIRCRAIVGVQEAGGIGWLVASGLTFFIPNLLGMPIWNIESELQVEAAIFDVNNILIGQYISDSHCQKTYAAAYWGYFQPDRKNVRDIFTTCMEDIKRRIANDYDRLNDALK